MAGIIYAGYARTSSKSLIAYKADGTTLWSSDHGNTVFAIAYDFADDYIYTGGRSATSSWYNAVRKWDTDGNEITSGWPISNGVNFIRCLCVDSAGAVYVGGDWGSGTSRELRKFSSSGGSAVWQKNHGNDIDGIANSGDGHIIAVGASVSSKTIWKINSSTGATIWSANHGAQTNAVFVDASGDIYTGGDSASGVTIRKWDTDGNEITTDNWPISIGPGILDLVGDSTYLFATGYRDSNITTYCYLKSTGAFQWSADYGNNAYAIAVDSDGNSYVGGPNASGRLKKYDSDGTEITSGWPVNPGTIECLVVGPLPTITSEPPGLPLDLALGTPFATAVAFAPGLPLRLALGRPDPPAMPLRRSPACSSACAGAWPRPGRC
jgi:hypothetical protein